MAKTSPKIVFGSVTFTGSDVKECFITEEFSPLSITVPSSALEFVVFSDDITFSIINPTGNYEALTTKQPLALYVTVDGVDKYLGQYFIDDWSSETENLKRFSCVDAIGILDKYTTLGGLWTTPTTVGEIVAGVLDGTGIGYTIDPDVAALTVTGWLPISTCREALQQIAFAVGAFVTAARRDTIEISRLVQIAISNSGIRSGVANAGQSRNWQLRFRPTQTFSYSSGGYVTKGIRSGVGHTGQSRNYINRWRQSQWEGARTTIDILASEQSGRDLKLREDVTGVEVVAHDISADTGNLTLLDATLAVGDHLVEFSQPMHTLSASGATISESGANYAILTVSSPGAVTLNGLVYKDTKRVFSRYQINTEGKKENILRVTDGTLVSSTNAAEVCSRLFDYYQQRYVQRFRMFSPVAEIGGIVNAKTLYDNTLYGVIEQMETNLAGGNIAETEVVGVII